jgi:hypothetical protein
MLIALAEAGLMCRYRMNMYNFQWVDKLLVRAVILHLIKLRWLLVLGLTDYVIQPASAHHQLWKER